MRLLALLLALPLSACGPGKAPDGPKGPTTRFREGDFVAYRYTGTYTKEPVVLREEIRAQNGLELRIAVSVRRGIEERKWVQVVTDLPENRQNQVVDALFLDDHGTLRKLENKKNRDLFALYEWTFVRPDGAPKDAKIEKRPVDVHGAHFDCDVRVGTTKVDGRWLSFEETDCADFLWTHAGARYFDPGSGEEFYRAEVIAFGHK